MISPRTEVNMDLNNDFVDEKIKDFDIEGRSFGYKPVTAGQENEWTSKYMILDIKSGKTELNWGIYNKCKLQNLVKVPYDITNIKHAIGVEKEWKDLNVDQRWDLLEKLKPKVFEKIINKIAEYDEVDKETKKN